MINKLRQAIKWLNEKIGWFFNPSVKQGKEKQNSIYK